MNLTIQEARMKIQILVCFNQSNLMKVFWKKIKRLKVEKIFLIKWFIFLKTNFKGTK